jgi:hypothetical protein
LDEEIWRKNEDEIKMLVLEIVDKRLKGEIIFDEAMWEKDHQLYFAGAYRTNKACTQQEKGLQPNDQNIFSDIVALRNSKYYAEYETQCAGLIYLAQKKNGRNVYLCPPDSNGPDVSLRLIEKILSNVSSKIWTLETLTDKIPSDCKTAINSEEICPSIEVGYQDAIKVFEV